MTDNEIALGLVALVLVVFSLVVSLLIPRRDPGFPGRNIKLFTVVAVALVIGMLTSVELLGAEHEEGEGGGGEATQAETGGGEGEGSGGAPGDAAAGGEIFASQGCGSCHVLEEAGSTGAVGPNLDESQVDLEQAVEQITNGGGGMPPFGGRLSEEEIQNVAAFVVESQG
jgi:cytochrome c553